MYIGAPVLPPIPLVEFETNPLGALKTLHISWCDVIQFSCGGCRQQLDWFLYDPFF